MPPSTPLMPGPTGMPAPMKLKGGATIWVGVALIVVGIVAGIAMLVHGVSSAFDNFEDMQRVPVSTGGTVFLTEDGTHHVYVETATTDLAFDQVVPRISITTSEGTPVVLRPPSSTTTYSYNGRDAVEIGEFPATRGSYRIRTITSDGQSSTFGSGWIAVSRHEVFEEVGWILAGIFIGGAIVVVGIALVIIGAIRRVRSRRAQTPWGGWAPPPVAWGYPGQPGAGWAPPPGPPSWAPPPTSPPGWVPPAATPPAAGPPGPGRWAPPPPAATPPPSASPPAGGWPPPPPGPGDPTHHDWPPQGDPPA